MKTIHWIIPISFVVFAFACKEPDHDVHMPLLKGDYAIIPYKLNRTVHYMDAQGNLSTLTVSKDLTWWDYSWEDVRCQYHSVSLSSNQREFGITLSVYGVGKSYVAGASSPRELRHLDVCLLPSNNKVTIFYDYKGNLVMFPEKRMYLYDSLIIGNHTYYEVALREDETAQLYYNKTHGVLQIKQNGENIFTLRP